MISVSENVNKNIYKTKKVKKKSVSSSKMKSTKLLMDILLDIKE